MKVEGRWDTDEHGRARIFTDVDKFVLIGFPSSKWDTDEHGRARIFTDEEKSVVIGLTSENPCTCLLMPERFDGV